MPCFRVYTNVDASKAVQIAFLKEASAILAKELKKPAEYVTVSVIPNQTMLWGGEDVPCAQIYLMSLGGLGLKVNPKISKKICDLLKLYFNISSDRYYIHFMDVEGSMIGYEGDIL